MTNPCPSNTGLSLEVATVLFRTWIKEKDMPNLATGLKKANVETKLLVSIGSFCQITISDYYETLCTY